MHFDVYKFFKIVKCQNNVYILKFSALNLKKVSVCQENNNFFLNVYMQFEKKLL